MPGVKVRVHPLCLLVGVLSALTGTQIPAPIAALQDKAVRFEDSCAPQEMGRAVLRLLGIG